MKGDAWKMFRNNRRAYSDDFFVDPHEAIITLFEGLGIVAVMVNCGLIW
jgi:hypothetical protein